MVDPLAPASVAVSINTGVYTRSPRTRRQVSKQSMRASITSTTIASYRVA